MIEQLISRVFYTRNVAHWAHWRTKAYSQHMALGDFYDAIIDTLDKLVEAHQGRFELVGAIPAPPTGTSDILKHLEAEQLWIEDNRSKVAQDVPALENIVDELSAVYLSAIYKLKTFK